MTHRSAVQQANLLTRTSLVLPEGNVEAPLPTYSITLVVLHSCRPYQLVASLFSLQPLT